jgi:hypothetical protein
VTVAGSHRIEKLLLEGPAELVSVWEIS